MRNVSFFPAVVYFKSTVCIVGQFRGYFIINAYWLCVFLPNRRPPSVMMGLVYIGRSMLEVRPYFYILWKQKCWRMYYKSAKKGVTNKIPGLIKYVIWSLQYNKCQVLWDSNIFIFEVQKVFVKTLSEKLDFVEWSRGC